MSVAQDLDKFIKNTGDKVFIEAEGRPSRLKNFYAEYNMMYSPSINNSSNGIIVLEEDANKWGLELRLYLHQKPNFFKLLEIKYIEESMGIELMMLML